MSSLPYTYPWNNVRGRKGHFFLRKWRLKHLFFLEKTQSLHFRVWKTLFWGLGVPLICEGFWVLLKVLIWGPVPRWKTISTYFEDPSHSLGTQVPLPPSGIHLLCCSLRLLMPPPVDTEVHTSPFHRPGGPLLNRRRALPWTKTPNSQGGSNSLSFIEPLSWYEEPNTLPKWVPRAGRANTPDTI